MVLKQELSERCVCGQPLTFPDGQIRSVCQCGAVWELGPESFWRITGVPLTKIFTQSVGAAVATKLKADEYPRYPRGRKRKGGDK